MSLFPYRILFAVCLLLAGSLRLQAQTEAVRLEVAGAIEADTLLPRLIDTALKYNPDMASKDNAIGIAEQNLKIAKKLIYNAIAFGSSYNYGNTGNFTSGQLSAFTLTKSNYYNTGISIAMPVGTLLTRKNTVRAGEMQVKSAALDKDITALQVKQLVINMYQEVKVSLRLMRLSSEGRQNAQVNYRMAEKQFTKGDVGVADLARMQDTYTKASIDFEATVNRFQTAYLQLEAFIGVPLSTFVNR